MRSYMRDVNLGEAPKEKIAAAVGMTGQQIEDMYRLLAIADYDDRYVIPMMHAELGRPTPSYDPMGCSLDGQGGIGMTSSGATGRGPVPLTLQHRHGGGAYS